MYQRLLNIRIVKLRKAKSKYTSATPRYHDDKLNIKLKCVKIQFSEN